MSELTRCNFCTLNDIKALARQRKAEVHLEPKPIEGFPEGQDVFITYASPIGKTWSCWLAKIPQECHCDD